MMAKSLGDITVAMHIFYNQPWSQQDWKALELFPNLGFSVASEKSSIESSGKASQLQYL